MAASSIAIGYAPLQNWLLAMIRSSNSRRVDREGNADETSKRYSAPLTVVHSTVEDDVKRPYIASGMPQVI